MYMGSSVKDVREFIKILSYGFTFILWCDFLLWFTDKLFKKKFFFVFHNFEVQQCSAIVSRVRFYSAIHEFVTCLGFNIL